jgi:DNA-binding IclR family transcriptional regulator
MALSASYRHVPAVDKAARLLAALDDGEASGISDLARRIGASKGTVRDILLTLAAHELVTRDGDGRFRLRERAATPRRAAREALLALAREAGETAFLGVVERDEIVIADVVEPPGDPHMSARVGWRVPAHVGAHGKALRGEIPGLDDEEYLEGVRAAAAPIVDGSGRPLAVLIVVGFKSRLSLARLRQLGRSVATRAAEASAALAGRST